MLFATRIKTDHTRGELRENGEFFRGAQDDNPTTVMNIREAATKENNMFMRSTFRDISCAFVVCFLYSTGFSEAADLVQLSAENWDEFAPQGKEVDCIYGDYVLRNEVIVAVIAEPRPGRNANMTVRNVGGSVIDLTQRSRPSDQLSAFYPGAGALEYALMASDHTPEIPAGTAQLYLRSAATEERPQVDLIYEVTDSQPYLQIETIVSNPHAETIAVELQDSMRADRSFKFDFEPGLGLFWASDEWWRQAYGIVAEQHAIEPISETVQRGRPFVTYTFNGSAKVNLAAGESHSLRRKLIPANDLLELKGLVPHKSDRPHHRVQLAVTDPRRSVYLARVDVSSEGKAYGWARTGHDGRVSFTAPAGEYQVKVQANGRPATEVQLSVRDTTKQQIEVDLPGAVAAQISDDQGRPIPCKVEFRGQGSTPDPHFGPDTFVHGVQNLYYSASGRFRQHIGSGKYDVIISHGNEYDAIFTTIDVQSGQETKLHATLIRTVDTTGWVSSDFHSHSSPSGDNTSSQRGRVLNLLCEHIEFAPCTEHNRVSTYHPHLEHFHSVDRMATCSGMELTGSPLPINHQNAFPIKRKPRTQDGGGPTTDQNPLLQIERLAFWDQRAQKVVQGNHPNLVQILADRDLDGSLDGGFARMLGLMDVVEVHPPHLILTPPSAEMPKRDRGNVIFNWLQMLNQGYRVPGVVNTDAHYNFHGSGWLRNYLKSVSDDPSKLRLAHLIQSSERGNIVMTNGPFLEVHMASHCDGQDQRAIPGDDLLADGGKATVSVRVQCPNWLDINRVQFFLNGRPEGDLNFTRRTHADLFGDDVVKFEHEIPLQLESDTHLIVVAAGEELSLGPVAGPQHGKDMPIAVTNPIFIDVDSDGFQPNGDLLGRSLP